MGMRCVWEWGGGFWLCHHVSKMYMHKCTRSQNAPNLSKYRSTRRKPSYLQYRTGAFWNVLKLCMYVVHANEHWSLVGASWKHPALSSFIHWGCREHYVTQDYVWERQLPLWLWYSTVPLLCNPFFCHTEMHDHHGHKRGFLVSKTNLSIYFAPNHGVVIS